MRGQVIQRGPEKYLLRVYIGRDENGKRQYHSKMFYGKPLAANRALTQMLHESDTETLVRPTEKTLAAFVRDWYASKVDISPHTLHDYKLKITSRLLPIFGVRKLHQISPTLIQNQVSKWIEEGLSPRTVEYLVSILHNILDYAVELGFLVRNPTDKVNTPPRTPRQFTVLSPEQMVQLFRATAQQKHYPLWVLMLTTGMRPGEALGLKWDDLNGNLLTINRTVRGRTVQEAKAKTDGSLRTVVVSQLALDALKAHRVRQNAEMLSKGPHYVRNGFIFATSLGKQYNPTATRFAFQRALRRAGLPDNVRLYDTRHSHATALLNAGVSLKEIADRLGHSSTRITESVYARLVPKTRENVAQRIDEILHFAVK